VRAEDIRPTLNRSAILVKPKQPFLDWLHGADSTSSDLTLQELVLEPAIYLIPECDTAEEVADVLHELCEEIFVEQLAGCSTTRQPGLQTEVSMSSATGSTINTIPC
jgi:hypothetical protein